MSRFLRCGTDQSIQRAGTPRKNSSSTHGRTGVRTSASGTRDTRRSRPCVVAELSATLLATESRRRTCNLSRREAGPSSRLLRQRRLPGATTRHWTLRHAATARRESIDTDRHTKLHQTRVIVLVTSNKHMPRASPVHRRPTRLHVGCRTDALPCWQPRTKPSRLSVVMPSHNPRRRRGGSECEGTTALLSRRRRCLSTGTVSVALKLPLAMEIRARDKGGREDNDVTERCGSHAR